MKDEWLKKSQQDLADLNRDHQKVLEMLEARNQWALKLNQEVEERTARVKQLQDELATEQADARSVVESYDQKILALEEDVKQMTAWAVETEQRLTKELAHQTAELGKCVELLQKAEKTVEERTVWAQRLERQVAQLEEQIALVSASRWLRLGRRLGLGPELAGR